MLIKQWVDLEEQQHRRLRALGQRSGLGFAAQVRIAVDEYLVSRGATPEPLDTILGRFRARNRRGPKPHDLYYAKSLR
jgi:hypothetical protein